MTINKRNVSKALLIIGAVIRFLSVPLPDIWYDEAFSLALTRLPLLEMVRIQAIDFNPPLWELVLLPFAKISDRINSLSMLRLPALLAGLLSLWLVWQILEELEPTGNQRLFTCLLAGLLPVGFWVAADARVYSLFIALYLAAALFAIRSQWLGLTAVCGLMMYAFTTAAAFVSGVLAMALYLYPKQWKQLLISATVIGAVSIPWLITWTTGPGMDDYWLGPLSWTWFTGSWYLSVWVDTLAGDWRWVGVILMHIYSTIALVISLSLTLPAIWRLNAGNAGRARTALKWIGLGKLAGLIKDPEPMEKRPGDDLVPPLFIFAVLPLLIMVLASLLITNVVFYRPLTLLVIPAALWIGATTAPSRLKPLKLILPGVWVLLIVISLVNWPRVAVAKGGYVEAVVDVIEQHWEPGDVLLYATGTAAMPIDHYTHHTGYILDADQHAALLQNDIQDAFGYRRSRPTELDQFKRFWMIWPHDPLIEIGVNAQMTDLAELGELVARINYWQAADIDVWLVENPWHGRGCGGCDIDA